MPIGDDDHRRACSNDCSNFADKTIWTGDNLDILRGM